MSEIEQFIGTLQGAHREQEIKAAVYSITPDALPPVPMNEEVETQRVPNCNEHSIYRREVLCTHEYREALVNVLRSCGVNIDEFLMSELVRRPDLQEKLFSIVTPYSEKMLHPDIHRSLAFVRDGIRARMLIEKLFTNGIVVLQDIAKKDERGIIDCFKRSSLGLSLQTLEVDAVSHAGRYVIAPYQGSQQLQLPDGSTTPCRYALKDTLEIFNEVFYFHDRRWHMATLEVRG